jgi:hypothetical protein
MPAEVSNQMFAVNAGLVFVLLHSLRWTNGLLGRRFLAFLWLGQSFVWMLVDPAGGGWGTFLSGATVLTVYFVARCVSEIWGSGVIPLTAAGTMCLPLLRVATIQCEQAPEGVIILGASFGLFVLGTVAAITKDRWLRGNSPAGRAAAEQIKTP